MDCIYTYNGKDYNFNDLVKLLAEKDLSSLAKRKLINIDPKVFEGALSSKTVFNDVEDAIGSDNHAVLTTDKDGNVTSSNEVVGKNGTFDVDGVRQFADNVNDIFRGADNKEPGIKIVASDYKTYNNVHKEFFDGEEAPDNSEAFYDKNTKTMYINGDAATLNALHHETSHIWFPFAEKLSPTIFNKGVELVKGSKEFKNFLDYKKAVNDFVKAGKKRVEALEQAKNIVILDKKEQYLYDYYRQYFYADNEVANEILARKVEESFKEGAKSGNKYYDWYNKLIKSIVQKAPKGFEGLDEEEINKLTLKQFVEKLSAELSGGIKATGSSRARKVTTEKAKEVKTATEIAKEQEIKQAEVPRGGRGKAKTEQTREPIYSTDVSDMLGKTENGKAILQKAEGLFEASGLLEQYANDLGKTLDQLTEAERKDLSEQILGDIMVGNLRVPSEYTKKDLIGTTSERRGSTPSGLVGEAFTEISNFLSTASGKDVGIKKIKTRLTKEIKPSTPEQIAFEKARTTVKEEPVKETVKSEEEQIIQKIADLQNLLKVENLSTENAKAIKKEIDDLVKKQQGISEKQTKVYGGGEGIELVSTETGKVSTKGTAESTTAPKEKPVKKNKIQQYQEEIDSHMGEIEYLEGQIEGIEEEIQINKGDLKEDLEKLKEKLDRARKTKLPKDEKQELIEEIQAEIEDTKDDMEVVLDNYKEDIRQHKDDIKKAQRAIKKLNEKIAAEPKEEPSAEKPIKKEGGEIDEEEEEMKVEEEEDTDETKVEEAVVQIPNDSKKLARRNINLKNWLLPADRKIPIPALSEMEKALGMKAYNEHVTGELLDNIAKQSSEYLKELNQGITDKDKMQTAEGLSKIMNNALKGDKAAFDLLSGDLKNSVDLMRANLDNSAEQVMSSGWLSPSEISTYQENLGTYVARIYEKYTTPEVTAKTRLLKLLRPFVKDKSIANTEWVKNLSPEQVKNAVEGFKVWVDNGWADTQADISAGTGFRQRKKAIERNQKELSDMLAKRQTKLDDKPEEKDKGYKRWKTYFDKLQAKIDNLSETIAEEEKQYGKDREREVIRLYEDAIQHVEKGQFMETANGSINMKNFSKRKDLPDWYRELIGESNNVYRNYYYTIGKLQNLGNKLVLHNNILEMGLEAGYVVKGNNKDPRYKNYVLVGGETAYPGSYKKMQGPLYGYKMDPLVYKAMFEMPSFTIGDETLQSTAAQKLGNVYMGSVDLINGIKVTKNLSSIIRNFESYFKGAFMLSGTYSDLLRTSVASAKLGKNFLVDGSSYYENRGIRENDKATGYIKGLMEDAVQDNAVSSISEDAFRAWADLLGKDKSFNDAISGKGNPDDAYKAIYKSMERMVKFIPKFMTKLFILGDVVPKALHYELRRNSLAYDAFGKSFYELEDYQMKSVREAAALDVKEDFATPSRAAEFGKFRGVGTFARYKYEMYRTFYNSYRHAVRGKDLDRSYKHLKWSNDKLENQNIINRLARNKRRTKMIGIVLWSGALQACYALMNGAFNSSKKEDQARGNSGVITNGTVGGSNLAVEAYLNKQAMSKGEPSMRQVVQYILPDYLYDKNIEYSYDPATKKLKVLNLSQNDQYSPITDWCRGLMYDKSPSDRPYANYQNFGNRAIDVTSDQLLNFVGMPVIMLQAIKTASNKNIPLEAESKGVGNKFATYLGDFLQGLAPGDYNTFTKNKEMADYAHEEYVDAAGQTLKDVMVSGFKGKQMDINVYSALNSRIMKEHNKSSDIIMEMNNEMQYILNKAAKRFKDEDGKDVYSYQKLTFDQREEIMKDDFIKKQINAKMEVLNNQMRATIKANKKYYIAAKKFGFTQDEIDRLFNDSRTNKVEVSSLRSDVLSLEDYTNMLQLSDAEIDKLDFSENVYVND
jgi:hypothetical protein